MSRLRNLGERLRTSLWLVPSCIVTANVVLALVLIDVEPAHDSESLAVRWPLLFGGGADGCRGLLTAIAGSMVTVAGVTFSTTIVAMALASSQYTSRILRNFMRDRSNQSVLGVFVGVFAYCLIVLRAIRSGDEGIHVPGLAVLGGLLLAFVAIACLIFFIHHIAASIQAASIIEAAGRETLAAVDRLFPAGIGQPVDPDVEGAGRCMRHAEWRPVPAMATGYIQGVDADALLRFAMKRDVVLRMEKGVGEFVAENTLLASVAEAPLDVEGVRLVNAAYTVGQHRTMAQDAGFGVRQIVDIALKALSPGINDTTTAIGCIDYLEAILARLATRDLAAVQRGTDGTQVRVLTIGHTFPGLLGEAFDQIRSCASGNVTVLLRMLAALRGLCAQVDDPARRAAIRQHAEWIAEAAARDVSAPHERELVHRARRRVDAACLPTGDPDPGRDAP